MNKSPRKTYSGKIKDKSRTMNKLVSSVGIVLTEKGYPGLNAANISRESGVDRKLITLYFGSLDNLIETYIKRKDYWLDGSTWSSMRDDQKTEGGSKELLEKLLINQIDRFANDEELRQASLWQISQKNEKLRPGAAKREELSKQFFSLADKELKSKNVDLRAITSLLDAGIHYLVLHEKSTESSFCELDISTEEGMDRIRTAIKKILNWTYQ